jgi:hypothetical protein
LSNPAEAMKRPSKRPERMWRASLIRAKAERLGTVYAPDREAAEARIFDCPACKALTWVAEAITGSDPQE